VGTKWNFYLGLCPFVVLMLFPRETLIVLFGADYEAGQTALMILAVGQLINSATGSNGPLLVMTGHQKPWLWLSASALVANIVLCFILIPLFGIAGAAIGTSITVGGMNLLAVYLAMRYERVWPYDQRYFKGIAAGMIAALCVFGFKFLPLPPFVLLFGGTLIFLIIFFLGLYLLHFDAEDFLLLSLIGTRLGVRFSF